MVGLHHGHGGRQGLISLIAIQFCFGASESGAWPAVTRTLSRWIPYRERGRAQGIAWVGAHITAGLTPLLVNELSYFMSWRAIFSVFGLIGLLWAAAWYWWFRDEPSQHAQVNEAELAYILADRQPAAAEAHRRESAAGPAFWWRLVTHRNVLGLCLMYLPNSFIVYFCITWFHKYLSEGRCMEGRELAFFAGLPLLLSVVADVLGGSMTDWAVRRFGPPLGPGGRGICRLRRRRRQRAAGGLGPRALAGGHALCRGHGRQHVSRWARPGEPARTSVAGMPAWSAPR